MRDLVGFLAVSALVIVTPGQDTALTIRNSLVGGRRPGVFTALGVASGQAVWTVAASAGLAALLVASEPAFLALKFAGAAYLVFLGAQALYGAVRPGRSRHVPVAGTAPLDPPATLSSNSLLLGFRAYRQGVISNLGNPKMAVFFTSLLPQFTAQGDASFAAMLALGLLFCTMTLVWLTLYAVAVAKAGDVLRRPRIRRALDAVMGVVLTAFGVRLATEKS